jgi:hypothetical protein
MLSISLVTNCPLSLLPGPYKNPVMLKELTSPLNSVRKKDVSNPQA